VRRSTWRAASGAWKTSRCETNLASILLQAGCRISTSSSLSKSASGLFSNEVNFDRRFFDEDLIKNPARMLAEDYGLSPFISTAATPFAAFLAILGPKFVDPVNHCSAECFADFE
jgi:hypothetical protein